MPHRPRTAAAIAVALGLSAAALGAPGCGTDAQGVEACRSIETARCKNASNCNISLGSPPHRDSPATDVDNCISFYRDECLHGLQSAKDPGQAAVDACVARINDSSAPDYCTVVNYPERSVECAFVSSSADAAADTATDTAPAYTGCPSGCTDFGVEFCGANHFCACTGALPTTPSNCTASSTNVSGGGAGYCCT
jgi:hypothetical protein